MVVHKLLGCVGILQMFWYIVNIFNGLPLCIEPEGNHLHVSRLRRRAFELFSFSKSCHLAFGMKDSPSRKAFIFALFITQRFEVELALSSGLNYASLLPDGAVNITPKYCVVNG